MLVSYCLTMWHHNSEDLDFNHLLFLWGITEEYCKQSQLDIEIIGLKSRNIKW